MKLFVFLAILALVNVTLAVHLQSQTKLESQTCTSLPKCACQKDLPAFVGISHHAKNIKQIGSLSAQEYNNKVYSPKSKNMNFLQTSKKAAQRQKLEAALPDITEQVQRSKVAEFLAMYQENGAQVSFLQTGDEYVYWEVDGTVYYKYIGTYRDHEPGTGYFAWTTTTCTQTYERDNETIEGKVYVDGDKQLVWYDSDDLSNVIAEAEQYGYYVYDYTNNQSYFIPAQFTGTDVRVNWEPWYWVFSEIEQDFTQEELSTLSFTYDRLNTYVKQLGYGFSDLEIQYVFSVLDETDNNTVTINEMIRQRIRIDYAEIADQVLDSCINEDGSSIDGNDISTDVISRQDGSTVVNADFTPQSDSNVNGAGVDSDVSDLDSYAQSIDTAANAGTGADASASN